MTSSTDADQMLPVEEDNAIATSSRAQLLSRDSVSLRSVSNDDAGEFRACTESARASSASRRSSTTSTRVTSLHPTPGYNTHATASHAETRWLPITLRWPYLCTIIAVTIIILMIVIAFHITSQMHLGLSDDRDSSAFYFATNFLPTVVAVSYVLMLSAILDDVKRTEPYARAASPTGAPVTNTLFYASGAWWTALGESLPNRKRHRKFSPTMFCAAVSFILGFSLISPFSSTFMVSRDVTSIENRHFEQLSLASLLPIKTMASATTYHRIVGHVLQNITTSAWITDRFAVLPFWPTEHSAPSMGAFIGTGDQVWTAETIVFSTELECEPLHSTGSSQVMDTWSGHGNYLGPQPLLTYSTESGCALSVSMTNGSSILGSAIWTVPQSQEFSTWGFNSSGCIGDDLLIFSLPSFVTDTPGTVIPNPNYEVKGALCSTVYYFANATVTVADGTGASLVSVDEDQYHRNRRRIPQTFLDASSIQAQFLNDSAWTQRFYNMGNVLVAGPATVLAASHEFASDRLMQQIAIQSDTTVLKQRFLGEILRESFDAAVAVSPKSRNDIIGKLSSTRRRIIVVPAVAIILEVVLAVELVSLLLLLTASRPQRRPLGISVDPSTSIAVAEILSHDSDLLRQLSQAKITNPSMFLSHYGDHWNRITHDTIHLLEPDSTDNQYHSRMMKKIRQRGNLPTVLKISVVVCLLSLILAILITVSVLFGFSKSEGLHQTAFVYELSLSVGGMQLDAINPASVVTTLLAVCLGLWWGAVDSSIRSLQPFLALTEKPIRGRDGIALSYQTSYMLWAACRAIKRKHWLLALITFGTFYAQIFTIAMSALWSRQHDTTTFQYTVPVSLEVRQVPLLRTRTMNDIDIFSSSTGGETLDELFKNQTTSWMYGASIQLALNGSEPQWSSSGWSFAPLDLSTLPVKKIQNIGRTSSGRNKNGSAPILRPLAEVETIGVHARLECTPYDSLDNTSSWLTKHDLTDSKYWNISANPTHPQVGYELGVAECQKLTGGDACGYFRGTAAGIKAPTTFYSQRPRLSCCENQTDGNYSSASIGYWSASGYIGDLLFPGITKEYPYNLTVKWIRGVPREGFQSNLTTVGMAPIRTVSRHLIWQDRPSMAALNCRPVIETANARVKIDISSLEVKAYSLLTKPMPDTNAWTDVFVDHLPKNRTPVDRYGLYPRNVTASYGTLFLAALIGASDPALLGATPRSGYPDFETLKTQIFNIRKPGMNMDYMSYSMYSLAGSDHNALLDTVTMARTAQMTFSTFFQHYASNSVSKTDGGWVFGKLDERLPADLTSVTSQTMINPPAKPRAGETTTVRVQQPIEVLQMSNIAAGIAISALIWLGLSSAVLACRSRIYTTRFKWQAETIADTITMLASSKRLLTMLQEKGPRHMKHSDEALAELTYFVPEDSATRTWGIELAQRPLRSPSSSLSAGHDPKLSSSVQVIPAAPIASAQLLPTLRSDNEPAMTTIATPVLGLTAPVIPALGTSYTIPRRPVANSHPSRPLGMTSHRATTFVSTSEDGAHFQHPQYPQLQHIQSRSRVTTTPSSSSRSPSSHMHRARTQRLERSYSRLPGQDSPISSASDDEYEDLSLIQQDWARAEAYLETVPLENLARTSTDDLT